jgi:hypothetical protein
MRRIFLVIGIVVAVNAWWAIPAIAGCDHTVRAPAADCVAPNNNAPKSDPKADIPGNQGTDKAADKSPAIDGCNY